MRTPSTNVADALTHARGLVDAIDAEILLAHVLEKSRSWLFAHADDVLSDDAPTRFEALLIRRVAGEPVAYLTGRRGFWTLDLEVTPATLVPRPETEVLVEFALARIAPGRPARIADLGTGSGAIALAIASERRLAWVIATDASASALDVARRNAERHHIVNVQFRCGDWFAPLAGDRFDLIASNPPYIADGDPHLSAGDLRFEPDAALSSGIDGLDAIRTIVAAAPAHLDAGGWLLLEHGWAQGDAVRGLLQQAGFIEFETVRDLEGRDRVSVGKKP
ncbi:MAG: peptide chain release factor N(5)-glutamine methyltransferase [Thermomonas sp.]